MLQIQTQRFLSIVFLFLISHQRNYKGHKELQPIILNKVVVIFRLAALSVPNGSDNNCHTGREQTLIVLVHDLLDGLEENRKEYPPTRFWG